MADITPADCIKCGKPMPRSYGSEAFAAPFCENEKCALRGALQTGAKPVVMTEEKPKKKKKSKK